MLRIRELIARIVRILTRQLFEAAARFVPALRRGGERLVVLELQRGRRGLAVDRALVFLHRRRALSALRETPRVVHGLIARTGLAETPAEFVDIRIVRRDLTQLREILLRAAAVLAIGEHHAHAEERVRLLRIHAQHFLPRLFREVAAPVRLPVLALIDEHRERIGRRGLRQGHRRRGAQERRDHAFASRDQHALLHVGTRRPVSSKRKRPSMKPPPKRPSTRS